MYIDLVHTVIKVMLSMDDLFQKKDNFILFNKILKTIRICITYKITFNLNIKYIIRFRSKLYNRKLNF